MKCRQVADWLENNSDEIPGGAWHDMLLHSQTCPDCGLELRKRAEIQEAMHELVKEMVPPEVKTLIFEAINYEDTSIDEPVPFLERFLDALTRPLEIGLSLACIFMAIVLFSMGYSQKNDSKLFVRPEKFVSGEKFRKSKTLQISKTQGNSKDQFSRLTTVEVREFMKKLEDYRRLHPEMEPTQKPRIQTELAGFSPR